MHTLLGGQCQKVMLGWTAGPARVTDTARRPSSPLVSWRVWQKRRAQAASIFCFWSTGRCTLVSVGGFLHVDDTFDFVTMKKRAVHACVDVLGLGGSVGRGNRCRDLSIHGKYCIIIEMSEAPASALLQILLSNSRPPAHCCPARFPLPLPCLQETTRSFASDPKVALRSKCPAVSRSHRGVLSSTLSTMSPRCGAHFLLLPFPSSPHSYCKHCHFLPLPPPFLPPRPLVSA